MGDQNGKGHHQSGRDTAANGKVNELKGRSENNIDSFKREKINQKFNYFFVKEKARKHRDGKNIKGKKDSFSDFFEKGGILVFYCSQLRRHGRLDIFQIPYYSGLFNMVGFLVPVFMLFAITFRKDNWKKSFLEALPFAVFSGLAYCLPAFLLTYLGQEFPSIIGSIIGLVIVLFAVRFKFLVPKNVIPSGKKELKEEKLHIGKVIFPYLLLTSLLILGKFLLGNVGYLFNFGLTHKFNFFNPGIIFILTSFIFILL